MEIKEINAQCIRRLPSRYPVTAPSISSHPTTSRLSAHSVNPKRPEASRNSIKTQSAENQSNGFDEDFFIAILYNLDRY